MTKQEKRERWLGVGMGLLFVLIIWFISGCASSYTPVETRWQVNQEAGPLGAVAGPTVTAFSVWPDLFSAVCGAIVENPDGSIAAVISGSCNTPLGAWLGSPIQSGVGGVFAGAAAASVH